MAERVLLVMFHNPEVESLHLNLLDVTKTTLTIQ